MYNTVNILHSYWAYLVLLILVLATFNAIIKAVAGKEYSAKDFRISLFTLIVSHIQLLLGIVLYFVGPYISLIGDMGMGAIMKDSTLRSNIVEHPLTMIIAVALITIGYSKHKKKLTSKAKLRMIAIFYSIALILILAKIPWSVWM
ncbi:hypothetical protein BZARG_452 [Bizionia argentinensis JUB59]|uniref:50S ribosomal protein L27 n=1 Tax=Bizionia argentinensis JUB59 TaxID=1046627 RepID=G2EH65_9FLAO|nr:hypothetical protein [Bizionia argentinensis]EGV42172.1 hypothetical protein BZARG_452 [Bizionia argentinensis JUB59]